MVRHSPPGGSNPPFAWCHPVCRRWRDWLRLLKPRVVSLVVFTGWIGLFLGAGPPEPGAGVYRHPVHRGRRRGRGRAQHVVRARHRRADAPHAQTADPGRPDRAGAALAFGVALSVSSVIVMWLATNLRAATVLALSIGFYVFVYTIWLKRRTPQNIVIGGAAGAFPPLIGWAAVTGTVDVLAAAAVRDRVLLDTAAFLGAVAVRLPGLRPCRRADAAGGGGRA